MSSAKEMLLEDIPTKTLLQSSSQSHRQRILIGLCAVAILTTGLAVGMGMSVFYGDFLRECFRGISYLTPAAGSLSGTLSNIGARDVIGNTTNTVVGAVTVTRPNKFFGPTISPQLAAIFKATNHVVSVEKKDVEDDESTYDILEERATVSTPVIWQPGPGLNWTYQLSQVPSSSQLKNPSQYNVWDIDLFDTPASSIQTIQAAGSKVICYFSAGTVENWRSDSNQFQSADVGAAMGTWPGENWINTKSASVRKIMAARLDLAKSKGCNGVDPDNIDAYNHDTGFSLTQSDAVSYVSYLAKQAALRGLAISLKNSADIIPRVINLVQYSVEEACSAYSECYLYQAFTNAGKAVFHVEYPKGYGTVNTATVSSSSMASICTCKGSYHLSPIIKNNNLDSWQQQCP